MAKEPKLLSAGMLVLTAASLRSRVWHIWPRNRGRVVRCLAGATIERTGRWQRSGLSSRYVLPAWL